MTVTSYQQLARQAYDAHGVELARQLGVRQRPWHELGPGEQACWIKSVQATVQALAAIH